MALVRNAVPRLAKGLLFAYAHTADASPRKDFPPVIEFRFVTRRLALKAALGASMLPFMGGLSVAQEPPAAPPAPPPAPAPEAAPAPPQPFDFEALSARMAERAKAPYQTPQEVPQELLDLTYDELRSIRFRPDHALWREQPVNFQLHAFYPGFLFRTAVHLFVGDGTTFQPANFGPADFSYDPPLDPARFQNIPLPGIAGFRIHSPLERPDYFDELVTFLGASYFRALGMGSRYGLSARGIAINTATGTPEEFPSFTAFYVTTPKPGDKHVSIMAELDSPSLTGAYAFRIEPGPQTVMDVTCRLYFRNAVERLGVAPLTSMFHFGENDPPDRDDFRPEVHDSDGLVIERSNGERFWRPLKNPKQLSLSVIGETSPRAFGLLQRDRDFSHYEDLESRYDLRPSLMIEPVGEWGKGSVLLVEIPTDLETNDNIAAFWVPENAPQPGSTYEFRYRMSWGMHSQETDGLAYVTGTYAGLGGNSGSSDPVNTRRFAVNFAGGTLANLPNDARPDPVVSLSDNARLHFTNVDRLPDGGWRLTVELERTDSGPVEISGKLSMLQRIQTETWLYQWTEEQ